MSKSLGNTVCPFKLNKSYSVEEIRLYFLAEGPLNYDVTFSAKELVKKNNLFVEGFSKLLSLNLKLTLSNDF